MIKIVHIITGLYTGGAETMLYKLLSKTNRPNFSPVVISLMDRGTFGDRIEALGIPVHTLNMNPGKPSITAIGRLTKLISSLQPDIIQGWMYHANLAAQIAKSLTLKSIPVVWNIRHSLDSLDNEKLSTATVIRLSTQLSRFPVKIVYNSKISSLQHQKLGYPESKTSVIANGFDTDTFKPSIEARIDLRQELGLDPEQFLIGRLGRYHPMKDHANFFRAAAILVKEYPDIHFVLAGYGIDRDNSELSQLIDRLGLAEQVHLLGERKDMPRITAGLDIASTSSYFGEAFPNVIGEAMSCGIPCAVTDVGDSAWIVGDTGRVVSPKDSEALAMAWKELIAMGIEEREKLGIAARQRIIDCFSLLSIVDRYEQLYNNILIKK